MLQALTRRLRAMGHPAQLTLVLSASLRSADDLLARLRALGLRRIARCRLTRNRNVMVSFGGDELRGLLSPEHFFGGSLRSLEVRVSRRMRARLGHYIAATAATAAAEPAEIAISRRHLRRHGWDEALHTLLHEMVHQWQDEHGLPIDHGATFRRKAREVGIAPCARRTVAA